MKRLAARPVQILTIVSVGWLLFCFLMARLREKMLAPVSVLGGSNWASPVHLLVMAMPIVMLWAAHLILTPRARLDGDNPPTGWVNLPPAMARRHRLYGVRGMLASLVAGLMLSAAARVATFVLLLPPVKPASPDWYLFFCQLLFVETAILGALYALCFAAALHHRGDFPTLLMITWLVDLVAGFAILFMASSMPGFPQGVSRLLQLLADGNSWRIFLSSLTWAPYLIVSRRVNVTFRGHVRQSDPLLAETPIAADETR